MSSLDKIVQLAQSKPYRYRHGWVPIVPKAGSSVKRDLSQGVLYRAPESNSMVEASGEVIRQKVLKDFPNYPQYHDSIRKGTPKIIVSTDHLTNSPKSVRSRVQAAVTHNGAVYPTDDMSYTVLHRFDGRDNNADVVRKAKTKLGLHRAKVPVEVHDVGEGGTKKITVL